MREFFFPLTRFFPIFYFFAPAAKVLRFQLTPFCDKNSFISREQCNYKGYAGDGERAKCAREKVRLRCHTLRILAARVVVVGEERTSSAPAVDQRNKAWGGKHDVLRYVVSTHTRIFRTQVLVVIFRGKSPFYIMNIYNYIQPLSEIKLI